MGLTPVESSNLDAIGFDGNEVMVQFKNGKTYAYRPEKPAEYDMAALFEDFANAESKGKFFAEMIRGRFPVRTVEDDSERPG